MPNDNNCTALLHFVTFIQHEERKTAMAEMLQRRMTVFALSSRGVSSLWSQHGQATFDELAVWLHRPHERRPFHDLSTVAFAPPTYAFDPSHHPK